MDQLQSVDRDIDVREQALRVGAASSCYEAVGSVSFHRRFYNSMAIGALLDRRRCKARKLGAWSRVGHARNRNRENFCWWLLLWASANP